MNDKSTCIWNAAGICVWDINRPGEQVRCYAAGCRDFDPRLTTEDYKRGAGIFAIQKENCERRKQDDERGKGSQGPQGGHCRAEWPSKVCECNT